VHFELRRNILQDLAFILANAVFSAAAGSALLVGLNQVMLVSKVRQLIEIEFPATATTCGYWARQLWLWLKQRTRCARGFEIEQMILSLSLDDLLGPPAVDPALQGAQFLERGLVRGLQRSYDAAVSSSTRSSSDASRKAANKSWWHSVRSLGSA
jgi:hypothetical protein